MNKKITLSYVLTTRNKLPYLKEVMKRLLENVQADEEIVITDGASTDGTVEFLSELYNQGKIQQFISEPDFGEAHGFNKGILIAKGELIKILSDDDAFYYPGIQECKKFMMENKDTELLSSNGATSTFENSNDSYFLRFSYDDCYKEWLKVGEPYPFCGLGIMFRRDRISRIGLFNTGIVRVDYEFGLRATSLNLNFVWYTGNIFVRILNNSSNSWKFEKLLIRDEIRCDYFYKGILPEIKVDRASSIKQESCVKVIKEKMKKIAFLYRFFLFLKSKVIKKKNLIELNKTGSSIITDNRNIQKNVNLHAAFENAHNWLNEINLKETKVFLSRKN